MANQYSVVADSFAEKLKQGAEELALKMKYMPSVSKLDNDERRISFTAKEVIKGVLNVVFNYMGILWVLLWAIESEDGMKNVLESGPWMVQNIPLVLNLWEPGIWLEKVEPSTIPIWVCVYNIPMELCNGSSIGKIMSGIGRPLLMDKMTKERCLRKAGKLDFARVLVEVFAMDDLLNVLEIAYPPIGNSPAKI
ncbi:RNA-directed DNA polymerase, eukaryota, reverse transcriptase zinc-binding domain protein, partial [Tanacetum coccineum]